MAYIYMLFIEKYILTIVNGGDLIEEIDDILDGPDNEHYNDSWETIISKAILKNEQGDTYILHQDGDLWGVAEDDEEFNIE